MICLSAFGFAGLCCDMSRDGSVTGFGFKLSVN